jgi:hypothetical protein
MGARRNTSPAQLELTNDASVATNSDGWVTVTQATSGFSTPYNTTLNSNSGTITWNFNMRQVRADPSGLGSGGYGVAFVLGGSSSSVLTAGNGYAVVLGQTGGTDAIRLVRYATGLRGTLTDMIVSNTSGLADFGAEYLSIRVTYNTFNNGWELFVRNDGSSDFADPTTGTLVSQGTLVNTTHTGTVLGTMGAVWNTSNAANQPAFFDNVSVIITPSQKTYTGATGGDWGLSTNWTPAGVPTASEDVVIPNNIAVTVNVAATCRNMRIAGGDQATTVTISGSNSLTVSDLIEFLAGTGSGDDKRIAVGAGTLTAARVTMATTGNNNRDCAITVSSGTLNISTSVTMLDANTARNFIEFTGAGTFNLSGSISGGDFVPGSSSTMNFNGSVAQTIPFGSYSYFNLFTNNTNYFDK